MRDPMQETFKAMREYETSHAPTLETLLAKSPRRRKLDIVPFTGLALAIALLLIAWPRHMDDAITTLNITNWRAPTDTLLATPGRELMRDLPDLHESILNIQGSP